MGCINTHTLVCILPCFLLPAGVCLLTKSQIPLSKQQKTYKHKILMKTKVFKATDSYDQLISTNESSELNLVVVNTNATIGVCIAEA